MKRGKKYVEAAKTIDRGTLYDVADAVSLVKKTATAKFDETIEAHIRTGCDGRHADQQIRGAVVLPHGTGKKVRILVFAKDAKAEEAKAAGLIRKLWLPSPQIRRWHHEYKAEKDHTKGVFQAAVKALLL